MLCLITYVQLLTVKLIAYPGLFTLIRLVSITLLNYKVMPTNDTDKLTYIAVEVVYSIIWDSGFISYYIMPLAINIKALMVDTLTLTLILSLSLSLTITLTLTLKHTHTHTHTHMHMHAHTHTHHTHIHTHTHTHTHANTHTTLQLLNS